MAVGTELGSPAVIMGGRLRGYAAASLIRTRIVADLYAASRPPLVLKPPPPAPDDAPF